MTYRGLPADYDAWKTRSDRDDDWWNEPEPEDDMAEPADIAALVERLREGYEDKDIDEAADALEVLQAERDQARRSAKFWNENSADLSAQIAERTDALIAAKARAEKAEAEVGRLKLELGNLATVDDVREVNRENKAMQARAEKAEANLAYAREVLEMIADGYGSAKVVATCALTGINDEQALAKWPSIGRETSHD